jgi:hypothetical protein
LSRIGVCFTGFIIDAHDALLLLVVPRGSIDRLRISAAAAMNPDQAAGPFLPAASSLVLQSRSDVRD